MRTSRHTLVAGALLVVSSLGALGCSSPPPARLVALEMIETLRGTSDSNGIAITDAEIDCMKAAVSAMSEDEVTLIAQSTDQLVLDSFSAKLSACRGS